MNGDSHALYRYFDAGRILLYVGRSGEYASRELAHIARPDWMQFAASSTIERYPTPDELRQAEREAIKAEHPIFNKHHNDTPAAKARLRAYLEQAGRLDLLEPGPKMINRPERTSTDPWLSPADQAKKDAYERGEWVELWPGGPKHRKLMGVEKLLAMTGGHGVF